LWRLGSLQEAAVEARWVLQMAPQSLRAALLLADIAWQRGDLEEFAERFHQAQRLDPSGVMARQIWGDQHPLFNVLRVDPPLPMEGAGGGKYAKEPRASGQEEDLLPPANPPWLLDSPLPRSSDGADQQADMPLQAAPHPDSSRDLTPWSQVQVGQDEELAEIELDLKRIASLLPVQAACACGTVAGDRPGSPDPSPSKPHPFPNRRPTQQQKVPLALIVSNRTALEAKYGSTGVWRIHRALTDLADAISDGERMRALVLYLDDPQALEPYGLAPADPKDPQELKFTLNRLEERLRNGREGGHRGGTYLLLIGGHEMVPFHPLPDPNEDEDEVVLSDHPYAYWGDHYLSFERAVGRLPDGASRDLGFLLRLITAATEAHRARRRSPLWQSLGRWLGRAGRNGLSYDHEQGAATSFGYTASIWRRAAREVFSSIGQTSLLRTSPPLTCEEMDSLGPVAPCFSYFNLHGLRDSAYWYGQRDPTYAASYPLFPVAIKPDNIPVVPHPEAIVFSEACYGAHILNKHQMSSLALRFLATQALGVVGSTALAYGAVVPPLVGADLLAKAFWEGVKAGYPLGEALRQAKQALAQDMLTCQGYLDPEDQKTILSFILYGDPTLAVACPVARHREAGSGDGALPQRPTNGDKLTASTLCRRQVLEVGLISPQLMAYVQHHLASCLPSFLWEDVTVSAQVLYGEKRCDGGCSLHQSVAKGGLPSQAKWVFTLQQRSPAHEGHVHQQIAKVTVDSQGNLVKIAISR